jgi:hypothetical protein
MQIQESKSNNKWKGPKEWAQEVVMCGLELLFIHGIPNYVA